MGLNARMSEGDPRLYNTNRDLAHCFADVARETAARLEDGRWAALRDLLKEKGVTDEQLGVACQAACLFVVSSTENPKEKMGECLLRAGFWDGPELANIAYMAILGTVVMGMFWSGVHEVTLGGQGPTMTCQDLRELGKLCHEKMTMPRWKRKLLGWKIKLKAVWAALRGKGEK